MGEARRVAVVGAGLGGLATAITLRLQGFEVQGYEQSTELAEFGAGINISPNSVKFIQAVGLGEALHAAAPTKLPSWTRNGPSTRVRGWPLDFSARRLSESLHVLAGIVMPGMWEWSILCAAAGAARSMMGAAPSRSSVFMPRLPAAARSRRASCPRACDRAGGSGMPSRRPHRR